MEYSYETLHKLLLRMQSLDYPGYKDATEHGYDQPLKDYKAACLDAVASGRLLILSPWTHDPDKRTITRAECVALNQMAEEICHSEEKIEKFIF